MDLDHRPPRLQRGALPLSYRSIWSLSCPRLGFAPIVRGLLAGHFYLLLVGFGYCLTQPVTSVPQRLASLVRRIVRVSATTHTRARVMRPFLTALGLDEPHADNLNVNSKALVLASSALATSSVSCMRLSYERLPLGIDHNRRALGGSKAHNSPRSLFVKAVMCLLTI